MTDCGILGSKVKVSGNSPFVYFQKLVQVQVQPGNTEDVASLTAELDQRERKSETWTPTFTGFPESTLKASEEASLNRRTTILKAAEWRRQRERA